MHARNTQTHTHTQRIRNTHHSAQVLSRLQGRRSLLLCPVVQPTNTRARMQEGQRPPLPTWTPRGLRELVEMCWLFDPAARPTFDTIARLLEALQKNAKSGSSEDDFGFSIPCNYKGW